MKLYVVVKDLLVKYPELRSNDPKLIWGTLTVLGITKDGNLSKESFYDKKTPSFESITRCRRKIQQNHPELEANETVRAFRKEKESKKGFHVYHETVGGHYLFNGNSVTRCSCQIKASHDVDGKMI